MSRDLNTTTPTQPDDADPRQHPAQPSSPALRPGDDWHPPEELPHVRHTSAPLITATGITLIALGTVWPSWGVAVLGALAVLVGVWLWVREGVASWRAWLDASAGERP
ncbi:hypothetical protein E7T09_00920 [Deinococcus sp. KSM4-11]|uniref:hypothetical protein n=1 Tax=Deinococcus sp. KSM4-11 TaxID=2568654 RepID=UPI0010A53054|nr:hypothetical protein [Deinococcus sp. KSM4-11]THF87833.1 hypothetical protein E7T09_00920 [Deinococcus sp. KSM4-11]